MSRAFIFDRFDVRTHDHGDIEEVAASDGEWVRAQDALNREAVLQAQIRTLEVQLKEIELRTLERAAKACRDTMAQFFSSGDRAVHGVTACFDAIHTIMEQKKCRA